MASSLARSTYKGLQMHRLPIYRRAHAKHISTQLRSFSCWAPAAQGQLPVSVQHAASVSSLGSSLRIFLFSATFSSVPLPWSVSVCVRACVSMCVVLFVVNIHLFGEFVSAQGLTQASVSPLLLLLCVFRGIIIIIIIVCVAGHHHQTPGPPSLHHSCP